MANSGTDYQITPYSYCVLLAFTVSWLVFRFMDVGGWGVLNIWLAEAKKSQNTSMLVEILQVCIPV